MPASMAVLLCALARQNRLPVGPLSVRGSALFLQPDHQVNSRVLIGRRWPIKKNFLPCLVGQLIRMVDTPFS